jgi:short chain dehydrogenase
MPEVAEPVRPVPSGLAVALVTGGGTGIGGASALALARRGLRVAINYSRSAADAKRTADEITAGGGEAVALRADVADDAAVEAMVDAVAERWGVTCRSHDVTEFSAPTRPGPTSQMRLSQHRRGRCRAQGLVVSGSRQSSPSPTGSANVDTLQLTTSPVGSTIRDTGASFLNMSMITGRSA